jgi:type I restriction enzyme S subunit
MGQSPPSATYNSSVEGLPFFQGKAEFGALYPEPRVWCNKPGKVADADDILLCVRAPVGPTNLAPAQCCIGRGLASVRPESGVSLKYLLYAFRRFAAELDAKGTGTTFKAVSGKVVRELAIPIAPVAEQARIADALDELLSDLDAGVAALEQIRVKLAHYRASVLKAAVEGTLTTEWRLQHPCTEPASELLKHILAEHRRRWEEEQLRRFRQKGQVPPANWNSKYKDPATADTRNLPTLPQRLVLGNARPTCVSGHKRLTWLERVLRRERPRVHPFAGYPHGLAEP